MEDKGFDFALGTLASADAKQAVPSPPCAETHDRAWCGAARVCEFLMCMFIINSAGQNCSPMPRPPEPDSRAFVGRQRSTLQGLDFLKHRSTVGGGAGLEEGFAQVRKLGWGGFEEMKETPSGGGVLPFRLSQSSPVN